MGTGHFGGHYGDSGGGWAVTIPEIPHEVRVSLLLIPVLVVLVMAVMGGPCDDSTTDLDQGTSGGPSTG